MACFNSFLNLAEIDAAAWTKIDYLYCCIDFVCHKEVVYCSKGPVGDAMVVAQATVGEEDKKMTTTASCFALLRPQLVSLADGHQGQHVVLVLINRYVHSFYCLFQSIPVLMGFC